MLRRIIPLLIAACLAEPLAPASARTGCAADAMLILDGSASMAEIGFESSAATRIEEARAALRRAMPGIAPFRRVGMMSYGPGGASSCTGLTLHFPPMEDAANAVIAAADALRPDGLTPLTAAVARAAEALDYRNRPGVIVLVTDGNETCGGRPCALGKALAAQAADLTVHVIGFRAVVDFFSWNNPEQDPHTATTVARCLADATGGLFVTAETVDELVAALRKTLGCPLVGRAKALSAPGRGDWSEG